jgi:uncharacterized protein with PQ loop repeat
MSTTTVLAVIASTWGIAMALSPMLQIRAILEHRTSRGVSIAYLSVLLVGFCLWLAYGVALGNTALIVPNAVALVVCATTIGVARHFRA